MKKYNTKSAADRKAEMDEITATLEKGVKDVFSSAEFIKYLDFCSKLYRYSVNNQLLIRMQNPDATIVQSFTKWKECSRFVKKGEHGLKILAPIIKKHYKTDANGEYITDENGNKIPEEETPFLAGFKLVPTFDVSQTDGEPLPIICHELTGDVENIDKWIRALKTFIKIPVEYEDIKGGAKGYYSLTDNRIAIKAGMTDLQTIKTLIHESAHATLHTLDKHVKKTREQEETEAEAIAYVVAKHYNIDTSDYSFAYLAAWASGKETPELKASLETIRETAAKFIDGLDEIFAKDPEPSPEGDGPEKTKAETIAEIDQKIAETPVKLVQTKAEPEQPLKIANEAAAEEQLAELLDTVPEKYILTYTHKAGREKDYLLIQSFDMRKLFPLTDYKMIKLIRRIDEDVIDTGTGALKTNIRDFLTDRIQRMANYKKPNAKKIAQLKANLAMIA